MILQPNHIYEFGPFRLDVAERLLVRDGETIPLQPKAYDLLHVLVEHHGHLLEKDELLKAVWPDTVVEEVNLANNVSILRKALGEGGNEQQFIETVPRRGYRFVAPVREAQEGTAEPGVAEIAQAPVVQQEVQAAAATGEQPAQGISRLVKRRPALVVSLVILLLIGAAGAINSWSPKRQPAAPSATIKSIAVLPFKPLTASGRDEALELGMADTLITKLSNLKHLIVRPTSAVRKYTALDQDPLAAGREQKVDAVLESSFQRLGEKIRVTVRLVKVSDGSALWAYQCDEYCANIFAAQDAISEKVARALAPELTGKERALLAKRYTDNFEAYLLYVNGRFFWDKRTEEGMKKSIEYYEQTIRLDPNYALAYVGLANSYITLGNQSFLAPGEVSRKVKAAVRKALEIDDQLGEAHAALAAVYLYDREWSEAEKAHKRAIEVNPSYATAHRWYSYFLMSMGRSDEAMAEAKQAQELDPLSLANNTQVAASLMFARRYDQAIEQYRKTLEMDPQFVVARWYLGLAYMYKGQYSAAITEFRQVVASSRSPAHFATLGYAYAAAGRRSEAIKALDELKELSKQRYVPSSFIACIYVGLGEKDLAFAWMEKAYEEHDSKLNFLKVDPIFDSLRSDPRFTDLLRRMRLE